MLDNRAPPCQHPSMTMREWLNADADGLDARRLRLPSAFVLPLLPILLYAMVARGMGTVEVWTSEHGEGGVQTAIGQLHEVHLLPSIWILLILVGIAVAGHIVALGRTETNAAVPARLASVMWMWGVAVAAIFGGFAWLVVASAVGTDVGVPFPLMGTLTPLR